MDIQQLQTDLANTGAIVLECNIQNNVVSVACDVTSYTNFKECLALCEGACITDYPSFFDVNYFGNLYKFQAK